MRTLTDEEKEILKKCGSIGFTYEEVALQLDLDTGEVANQFAARDGDIYTNWMKGRLLAETHLREATLRSALGGDTQSLTKMLEYYKKTDRIHNEL